MRGIWYYDRDYQWGSHYVILDLCDELWLDEVYAEGHSDELWDTWRYFEEGVEC